MFANSGQVEYTGSGTITALNGAVTVAIPTSSSLVFQVTGTWAATLIFEASVDGTNYFTIPATTLPNGPQATTVTANGAYLVGVGGYTNARMRASAFTSGTAAIAWAADNTPNISSTVQQGNAPWSVTSTDNLTQVGGASITLGQKTMSASVPVTIASDQSAVPVSQSGTWNINNVSGTVSLPTGAATAANQSTEISSLSSIDTKLTSQATAAAQATQLTALQIIDDVPTAPNAAVVKGAPIMGQLDDISTVVATEDNASVARITAQRAIHVNLRNNAGTEFGTSSNPIVSSAVPTDGSKATYSSAVLSLNLASLATDFFTITGSATKTIRVTEICAAFTGGGVLVLAQLVKRSTANTGGTSTTPAAVSHDSTDSAATATVRAYTVNPTVLGTSVGLVRADRTASPLLTSTTAPDEVTYSFGIRPSKAIVLRGTGEVLAFNLNGVTLSSGSVSLYIEWTEE